MFTNNDHFSSFPNQNKNPYLVSPNYNNFQPRIRACYAHSSIRRPSYPIFKSISPQQSLNITWPMINSPIYNYPNPFPIFF